MIRLVLSSLLFLLSFLACKNENFIVEPPTQKLYPSSGVFLGNSMTINDIVKDMWWGYWGMAATRREKDYVHLFEARLKKLNPKFTASVGSATPFELKHATFDFSYFERFLANKPDLIVIRIGDNIQSTVGLQSSMEKLFDYIKLKAPDARIVLGGTFWKSPGKDAAMRAAADAKGILFVPLSHLETTKNKSAIGQIVGGDDGIDRKISNNAVANHPGDNGHQAMSDELFTKIFPDSK